MKELNEIIAAFDELCENEKPAALALVIGVEGSAYRKPGARMLCAEDGRTWGGVSGGCLERDVARRGRGVIATNRPVICKYEQDDGISATGCGGIVEILIQPISKHSPGPLPSIRQALKKRCKISLATMIRGGAHAMEIGDFVIQNEKILKFSAANFFLETISPPQTLIIFGDGPDVVPLVAIAKTLGWHVSVVVSRFSQQRFAQADQVQITSMDDPLNRVEIGADSAVVVMTHNLARDERILSQLPRSLRYLGLLGPRHRARAIMQNISHEPVNLFAPVGLDLGAQTPAEIALAIAAEIQAVIRDADAKSLRDQRGPIHLRAANSNWSRACQA